MKKTKTIQKIEEDLNNNMKKLLILLLTLFSCINVYAQNFEGTWKSDLLTITLQKSTDDTYTGVIVYGNKKMTIIGTLRGKTRVPNGDDYYKLNIIVFNNGKKEDRSAMLNLYDNGIMKWYNSENYGVIGLPTGGVYLSSSKRSEITHYQSSQNYSQQTNQSQNNSYNQTSQSYSQQTTKQPHTKRTISAKLCSFSAYYQFSTNGRVERFSYSSYDRAGESIVPGSEKYQYGSYYIDDSEYQNLFITWDNGATEKNKISWSNGKAGMSIFNEDNCK